MSKESDLLITFGCLAVLILIVAYYIIKICCKKVQRNNFVKEQTETHGMEEDTAKTLYDAAQARRHFIHAKKYYQSKTYRNHIEKYEYKAICADEYYQLLRWSKRLHEAQYKQDPDALDTTVATIINELNERAEQCLVKPETKERLLNLVRHQTELFLQKYDTMFV